MILNFFNPRRRSVLRGALLVLLSLGAAALLSDFPNNRANPMIVLPTLGAIAGAIDHVRCMRPRWDLYHGGVLLLIYMDLMALSMILFFLLYPYALWLTHSE
ncbi:permease [Edaphobacter albus]|uniref:permease n=1 Tax=Edaphobacter sp. 4G125 TaxID=2763071 RepID=UPI0016441DDA|nr:permease [Edaphobacter sp. 4G125]QNI37950.1 permease [Edaphobacter sp. 4G125]